MSCAGFIVHCLGNLAGLHKVPDGEDEFNLFVLGGREENN